MDASLYREILRRRLARAPKGAPSAAGAPDHAPAIGPGPPGPPPSDSSLVGRERELRHLRDALQTAWTGQARLVAVTGEAGIGKSRLATALAAEAARRGGRTLLGHCYESEHVLPFGPWIDALRAARLTEEGDVGSNLPAVWLAELARLLPDIGAAPPSGSPSDRVQLFEAIARLLERSAAVTPLLLILEDVHWADETSLRLLAFVGRRLAPWRLLVVVTAREEDLADSVTLRHTLDELAQDNHLVRMAR